MGLFPINLGHIKLPQSITNGTRPVNILCKDPVASLNTSPTRLWNVTVERYLRLAELVRQYQIYQEHLYLFSCIFSAARLHTQLSNDHVDVPMFPTRNIQVLNYLDLSKHKRGPGFITCMCRKYEPAVMSPSPCFKRCFKPLLHVRQKCC